MTLFILKKWLGALLSPLPILGILLTLLMLTSWRKGAASNRKLISLCWLWLMLFSTPFLPDYWLAQFESHYPKYQFQLPAVDEIIVLGCRNNEDPDQPITSQVAGCSMARLNEGIRILRHYPEARLVLSGGRIDNKQQSNAAMVAELAVALGVKPQRIITEPNALDTADEALLLAQRLQGRRLILVTSASHMPRAMQLFRGRGLAPTPAPTHYLVSANENAIEGIAMLPHHKHLEKSQRAFYETLGMAWALLTSWYHH